MQSQSRHFGGVSEKKSRSDHVTRNALAARNNEAYGQARDGSVQSFAIIKNAGHGNLFIGRFKLELEMDYPSETGLCAVAPSTTGTPSSIFLRQGAAVYRLSETDNLNG